MLPIAWRGATIIFGRRGAWIMWPEAMRAEFRSNEIGLWETRDMSEQQHRIRGTNDVEVKSSAR
jgi:hypothetical protein